MPTLLFVYGTLHPERAPREIAHAAQRLISVGSATIRARLYNLGTYPAAVLDGTAPPLLGELFEVPDDATLAALDAYEDFRPTDPIASLYLRVETIAIGLDGQSRPCQVYVYNHPIPAQQRTQ
jgi:gamma-glutamylcyclotransferase (GGCT)/AIG2-like uncharacterized protein YtfP